MSGKRERIHLVEERFLYQLEAATTLNNLNPRRQKTRRSITRHTDDDIGKVLPGVVAEIEHDFLEQPDKLTLDYATMDTFIVGRDLRPRRFQMSTATSPDFMVRAIIIVSSETVSYHHEY